MSSTMGARRNTNSSINTAPFRRKKNRKVAGPKPSRVRPALGTLVSVLLGCTALGGAAFGIHYGWECLKSSPRLVVQSIDVRGSRRASAAEVQAYTAIRMGSPILDVDLDAAALALRRHPWVASATVQRRLPDRIVVEIVEHAPSLVVSLEELYLADENGKLFKSHSTADGFVSPVLTGLTREQVTADPDGAAAIVRDGIALSNALFGTEVGRVEELAWDADLGWTAITRPARDPVRLHLGKDAVTRIDVAVAALQRLAELGRTADEIWADGQRNRDRVHVRLGSVLPSTETLIAKVGD
jgi:hypothetical protein